MEGGGGSVGSSVPLPAYDGTFILRSTSKRDITVQCTQETQFRSSLTREVTVKCVKGDSFLSIQSSTSEKTPPHHHTVPQTSSRTSMKSTGTTGAAITAPTSYNLMATSFQCFAGQWWGGGFLGFFHVSLIRAWACLTALIQTSVVHNPRGC